MADKNTTALTAGATLDGTELVHVVQSSNSRKTTTQDIADLAAPSVDGLSDTTITVADTGDILRYNGSAWVDYPDSNFSASGHTHALDDISDVDLTTSAPSTNDVLTYDGADWVPAAASGGGGWTVADTWDHSVDGTVASFEAAVPAGASEVMVVFDDVTLSVSAQRLVRVSTDNGSSYYSTSGDYDLLSTSGLGVAVTGFHAHLTDSAAARSAFIIIHFVDLAGIYKAASLVTRAQSARLLVSTDAITNVQALGLSGNMTGGTVTVLTR